MKKQHNNTRLICQLSAVAALVPSANAMADDAFSADSKWMTGDWGGERTKLIEQGIDIKADYVGEMGYNAHGGYNDDKTGRYSDQFGLGVALDLQKLWGWDNTQAKIQLTNRNGQNISNDRIGDPRAGTELQRAVKILGTAYGATRAPARRAQLSLATFQARDGNAAALARLGELGNLPAGDFELRKVAWLARAEAAGLRCHGRQRPAALAALRALDGELRKALPEGGSVARRVRAIAAGCQ